MWGDDELRKGKQGVDELRRGKQGVDELKEDRQGFCESGKDVFGMAALQDDGPKDGELKTKIL